VIYKGTLALLYSGVQEASRYVDGVGKIHTRKDNIKMDLRRRVSIIGGACSGSRLCPLLCVQCVNNNKNKNKNKNNKQLRGFSRLANYTDRVTAACTQS
jgi:hypothetical protein